MHVPTVEQLISVDDHVVEPPDLWTSQLAQVADRVPRTERRRGVVRYPGGRATFLEVDDEPDVGWTDVWCYEDIRWPLHAGLALAEQRHRHELQPVTYEDIAPGCWQQGARLAAMDQNRTEASVCFPTVIRFCGQMFLEARDKDLALQCVRAFNDWMIDDWCAGDGYARLVPLTIVPLWDPELAAAEVRRCADKGSAAITFSEGPHALGLPSMYSGHWDPLWAACQETSTVVNLHVGSSSKLPATAPDSNLVVAPTLLWENTMHALLDWCLSGTLARFPTLKLALSEGQVGWIPFAIDRMDVSWEHRRHDAEILAILPERPSSYLGDRVFGCVFDDLVGLRNRDRVGIGQICFETDYPHVDSTYPDSWAVAERLAHDAGLDASERWQMLRGNAIRCYGLERLGITS